VTHDVLGNHPLTISVDDAHAMTEAFRGAWDERLTAFVELELGMRESSRCQGRAKIALERNCGRMEWSVLDWNEPAIKFYHCLGAKPMDERTIFRLTRDGIVKLASSEQLEQRHE
jgi:hypothetical protein